MITGGNKGMLLQKRLSSNTAVMSTVPSFCPCYIHPSLPLRVWRLLTSSTASQLLCWDRLQQFLLFPANTVVDSSFWHYIALRAISCVSYHCGLQSHYMLTINGLFPTHQILSFYFLCYAWNPGFPSLKLAHLKQSVTGPAALQHHSMNLCLNNALFAPNFQCSAIISIYVNTALSYIYK